MYYVVLHMNYRTYFSAKNGTRFKQVFDSVKGDEIMQEVKFVNLSGKEYCEKFLLWRVRFEI